MGASNCEGSIYRLSGVLTGLVGGDIGVSLKAINLVEHELESPSHKTSEWVVCLYKAFRLEWTLWIPNITPARPKLIATTTTMTLTSRLAIVMRSKRLSLLLLHIVAVLLVIVTTATIVVVVIRMWKFRHGTHTRPTI